MSLADELLADLGSDEEFEAQINGYDNGYEQSLMDQVDGDSGNGLRTTTATAVETNNLGEAATAEDVAKLDFRGKDVKSLSHLMTTLEPILSRINEFSKEETDNDNNNSNDSDNNRSLTSTISPSSSITAATPSPSSSSSPNSSSELNIDSNPIYKLLVEANEYSVEIDSEIVVVHQFIKDNYSKRFDELGSLVPNPLDYAKAVRAIGNNVAEISNNKSDLGQFLTGATLMIITMSAFDNHGEPLTEYELDQVNQGCDLLIALYDAKQSITKFVSSKLSVFAPNITQIVSSHTAAQLMGFAGGLKGLARIPSANIPTLGSKRQVGIGFGHVGIRHQGFLYHSEIIQSVPADVRKQAMRIVSGKLVLAARVDLVHASRNGSQGRQWRAEINEKLEKLVEPPENKGPKALRIPEDKPAKKRGGRRIRKYKEQFQQTELQKAQNRMVFGKEEDQIGAYDESVGLGMAGGAGSGSSGQVRSLTIDNKTRAKMSKGMQARLNKLATTSGIASSIQKLKTGGNSQVSGLASSLSFTPVQGIELIDPSKLAKQKASVGDDQDRWFKSGTFTQITPKGASGLQLGPNINKPLQMAPPSIPIKRKSSESGPDAKKSKSDKDEK